MHTYVSVSPEAPGPGGLIARPGLADAVWGLGGRGCGQFLSGWPSITFRAQMSKVPPDLHVAAAKVQK